MCILFFSIPSYGMFFNSEISGFNFSTCGKIVCINVVAPKAYEGFYVGNYAASKGLLEIKYKETGRLTRLMSSDLYLDMRMRKIFIRNIKGKDGFEAIFDLDKERITYFDMKALLEGTPTRQPQSLELEIIYSSGEDLIRLYTLGLFYH